VLTDARGVPLGVAVAGANAHDQTLVEETLQSIPVRRPRPKGRQKQHLCCDKGYDAESVRRVAKRCRYVPHIRCRGEEAKQKRHRGARARRWVVERTHSWLHRARRLLIRWEKKVANYIGFLHLQFAYVALRSAGVIG
jgi:putative transposase